MDLAAAASPGSRLRRPFGLAYAALDLGTSNCRMLIAAPASEGFRVVDSFSRIVRLGEGLQASGRLSPLAMDRAMSALHSCADRLARRQVRSMRAIATEACRRADNGEEFLSRVRAETGIQIDIISAREEAELAVESCIPLLRGAGRRALLFDIGGGSTELAWVRLPEGGQPDLIGYDSLPVGVVTLAEKFSSSCFDLKGAFDSAGFQAMVDHVAARLLAFERIHCIGHEIRVGRVLLLGTSGTVTTLAGVALGLARYRRPLIDGAILTHEAAGRALDLLRSLGRAGLEQHPCIGPDRVEFVLPGCAIFAAIRQIWPAERIVVADRGLREGMLLRLIRGERQRRRPPCPGPAAVARPTPTDTLVR